MYLFIFVIGAFIGSFLNVLADRLPKGQSVIGGRSHCDHCKKNLAWYDLFPLLSFLILKGRCRYCRTRLSYYYPVVELVTGILFLLTFVFLGEGFKINDLGLMNILDFLYYFFITSCLIVVFFADLKYGIIPDKIVLPSVVVSFFYLFINHQSLIFNHFLSGAGALLFFLALFLMTKGKGMGFGDVKFSFLMGLILGFPGIFIALYIGFLTGALYGCILIIWKRKRLFGTRIPFGPFLAAGTIAALFFGENIEQIVIAVLL